MSTSPPLVVADRYRLVAPLGQGGMGRVWRATDVVLHREVAIKELVPPPGLTPDERREMRERSLREARAIARLNNINVVRVFDVLRTDADPWIVMEYVPSRSLQDTLAADGPFNPVRAAEIGLGVLNALRAAHRAGVVHRDVKPGNVLIGEDGRVVLTDFGLATVPGDPNVTRTGLVLGSPAYIAPERARDGSAGPGADLWSLGATLYAAVEGASPFARPSAIATLAALATENPPPARNAGPLKPVLNGLLRKDPAHRINAEEAERLLLRATGRRSRLSFPMSPTMRRPGAGRERPAPGGLVPPVVPGVSGSAPVVPGPRPPISPGRPPVFTPGKASVGGTPKPPALDATRIENLDRSRTGAAKSPPTPASKSAAHGTAPDATMRGSGSAPGSFTADEVAAARKATGRAGAPAAATPPEQQQPAAPAPRAASTTPTVADRPTATTTPEPATTSAAPVDSPASDAAGSAPAAGIAAEAGAAAGAATSVATPDATMSETAGTDAPETAATDPADGDSGDSGSSGAPEKGRPKKGHQPFGPRPSGVQATEPADAAPAAEATTTDAESPAEKQAVETQAAEAASVEATGTTSAENAPSPDETAAEPDQATAESDQATAESDQATAEPDQAAAKLDQATAEPGQAKEEAAAKAPAKTASTAKSSRKGTRGRAAKASAAGSGPVADNPAQAESTAAEPTAAEPTAAEPTAAEPTAAEPTAAEPTAAEPT
ncbi:protein kinase, partial [Actinoplanes sp. NPDC005259]|uniref:serine/threonine-protein kinase n=1 Tax=Actinoplanes sp. NPDC005259 TaxID=3154674 RepID=UPI0033A3D5AB